MSWLVDLSPWLQLPIILIAALPPAGIVAWLGVKTVDWVANRWATMDNHG